MRRKPSQTLRYTVERSEHTAYLGWVTVARVGSAVDAFQVADAFKRNGQPCRVIDRDLSATAAPVYLTR